MTLAPHASAGVCMVMHSMDHSAPDASAPTPNAGQTESLLDILKRRYALGEITTAQFEEIKRTLDLNETETAAVQAHH